MKNVFNVFRDAFEVEVTSYKIHILGRFYPKYTLTNLWKFAQIFVYLYLFFLQVPASCCKLDTEGEKVDCASKNPVDLDEIYPNDCFVEAVVFVRGHATIIGGVAVAIASIMVSVLNQNNKYMMRKQSTI